jgi:hypothetical protein
MLFRGLPDTAEQLRDDRIVEEAQAGLADPLHLATVFGFGPRTGLRYGRPHATLQRPALDRTVPITRAMDEAGELSSWTTVKPQGWAGAPDIRFAVLSPDLRRSRHGSWLLVDPHL